MSNESRAEAGAVIWFTGYSGAGKSTLANEVYERLDRAGVAAELLDGDAVRVFSPAGFSPEERQAHVRRVGFLASCLERHGVTVLCALVSPYAESRAWVRQLCRRFIEVHVSTPLAVCEERDVKGLYAKARRGEIQQFTGLDAPYEPPANPALALDTSRIPLDASADLVLRAWADRVDTAAARCILQLVSQRDDRAERSTRST